ncbi:hypothetical protein ACFLSK_02835 [Chloroflexota bacterium]
MINITRRARQELERLLSTNVDMPQARLRLVDRGQGELGLGIDIEMPGDELVIHDGSTVLIVQHELFASLGGVTIDVDDTPKGDELVMCFESKEHRYS